MEPNSVSYSCYRRVFIISLAGRVLRGHRAAEDAEDTPASYDPASPPTRLRAPQPVR